MNLKIYIDVFGQVSFCEKFKNTKENIGLNDLLKEFSDEYCYGDRYPEFKSGFYIATLELFEEIDEDYDCFLQIKEIKKPVEET